MPAKSSSSPQVIVSILGRGGETGVQKHVGNVIEYAASNQEQFIFIGPDECRRLDSRIASAIVRRILRRLHIGLIWYVLRGIDYLSFRRELRRRLRGSEAWCVYAQDPTTARAALSLKNNAEKRVVMIVHFNVSQADEMADRGRIARDSWVYRRVFEAETDVLNRVDGIVVPSRFMLNVIGQRCEISGRALLIPNSCRVPSASGATSHRDLIAIGSLEPRKNQQFLLRVLSEAKLLGHEYTLTLAGSGESREPLENLAAELGIQRQVEFLGRVEDAASLISSHTLFVHSALVENMPIALIESLAAGVPILAPRVGGITEIFDEGVEGCFWPLDNISDGAELLISLMQDRARLQRMSRAAKARYENCFSFNQVHGRLLSFIRGGSAREQNDHLAGASK